MSKLPPAALSFFRYSQQRPPTSDKQCMKMPTPIVQGHQEEPCRQHPNISLQLCASKKRKKKYRNVQPRTNDHLEHQQDAQQIVMESCLRVPSSFLPSNWNVSKHMIGESGYFTSREFFNLEPFQVPASRFLNRNKCQYSIARYCLMLLLPLTNTSPNRQGRIYVRKKKRLRVKNRRVSDLPNPRHPALGALSTNSSKHRCRPAKYL